jgi:hypothetical protein
VTTGHEQHLAALHFVRLHARVVDDREHGGDDRHGDFPAGRLVGRAGSYVVVERVC